MMEKQALRLLSIMGLAILVTATLLFFSEPCVATEESINDNGVTYTLTESGEGNYAVVTDVDANTTNVLIKPSVDYLDKNYVVRSIGLEVFKNNQIITEVTIQSNDSFFLSTGQFQGCSSLERVTIGEGVTEISDSAFNGCGSLREVTLPTTIASIGNSSFYGCSHLESIILGSNVHFVGESAFMNCVSLTQLNLNLDTATIADNAFKGCTGISTAHLQGVQDLGGSAFEGCSNLTSISLGNKLERIGIRAFSGTSITALSIPEATTTIGLGSSPSLVCFPSTMISLIIDANNAKYMCENNMLVDKETNTIVYTFGIDGAITVSRNIGPNAFYGQQITELTIAEGVTSIGVNAFGNNLNMVAVSIPSSIVDIGESAFTGCTNLSSVVAAEGLKSIGGFNACTKISVVELPSTIETINESAFRGCTGLTTINLPDGLKKIKSNAFNGCSKLSFTALPDSLNEIGNNVFDGVSFGNSDLIFGESHEIKLGVTGIITGGTITLNKVTSEYEYAYAKLVSPSILLLGADFTLFEYKDGWMISKDGKTLYGRDLNNVREVLVIPSSVERIVGTGFQNRADSARTHFTITCEDLTKTIVLDSGEDDGRGVFANLWYVRSIELPNIIVSEKGTFVGCEALSIKIASMSSVPASTFDNKYLREIVVSGYTSIDSPIYSQTARNTQLRLIAFPDTLTSANFAGGNVGMGLYDTSRKQIMFTEGVNSISDSAAANLIAGKTFLSEAAKKKDFYEVPTNKVVLVTENVNGNTYKLIDRGDSYDGISGSGQVYRIASGAALITLHVGDEVHYVAVDIGSIKDLIVPTKTGYGFEGWFTDQECTASFDTSSTINADQVLYAKFAIQQYTITFDTAGGSAVAAIRQDYNSDVVAPADPTKTGYTFAGWSAEIPAKMPADGMTITASWNINQYTITFDTAGGSAVAAIRQDYDSDVTAPEAPTRTGYTFAGWSAEVPAKMPVDGMTITASWTINQYTITFDTAGGSAIAAITQDYNTSVTAPSAEPARDGYRFVKWDSEIPESMPADNVIIKAVWAIVATVGENGKSVVTLDSETSSFIPAAETKEITVEIRENTAVKVENASDLIGKTVVSKVEPVSNSTSMSGTAYEFTFTADGTQYNGKIQVTLPYTKEAGKEPVVYYWNGSESTKMNVVSSTDTSVTFETDHNSMYVVASETPSKDDGLSFLLFFGLLMVVGIAVSMLVGFNFYRKKA